MRFKAVIMKPKKTIIRETLLELRSGRKLERNQTPRRSLPVLGGTGYCYKIQIVNMSSGKRTIINMGQ